MGAVVEITKNTFARNGVDAGNKKGIIETCILVNNQAKSLAPVDKAQLKNSLMYTVEEKDGGFNNGGGEQATSDQKISISERKQKNKVIGYQGTNSDHWYPEFGTRYQAAQPFERPAKEIVIDGGKSAIVMKRYGKEQMAKEFAKRKVTKKVVNG